MTVGTIDSGINTNHTQAAGTSRLAQFLRDNQSFQKIQSFQAQTNLQTVQISETTNPTNISNNQEVAKSQFQAVNIASQNLKRFQDDDLNLKPIQPAETEKPKAKLVDKMTDLREFMVNNNYNNIEEEDIKHALLYGKSLFASYSA